MAGRFHPPADVDRGDIDLLFWLSAFAAAALFLLRFGYDFGVSDQDEFLPLLEHLMDPSVLANDWFVDIQTSSFNVRTLFVRALLPLAAVVGVEASVHLAYALSFAGVCLGIYRIGIGLHQSNPVLAAAGVVLAVAVTARFNPGGNDIVAAVLTPSIPAWALALNGLASILGDQITVRRAVISAVLISLATALQGLVGLQAAALATVVVIAVDRNRPRASILYLVLLAVGAAISVVPVVAASGLFGGGTSSADAGTAAAISPIEILAVIRAPHHYLPSAFGAGRWVRLWIVVFAGIAYLWRSPDRISSTARRRMLSLIAGLLGALLVFRIWIALAPLGPAVLLQPFKMTVLLRVVCAVAAVGWLHGLARYGKLAVTGLALPTVVVLIGVYSGMLDIGRLLPFTERSSSPVADVHAWIARRTPDGAVFAVPPGHTGFSRATHRAQYVNFKAVPYSDDDLREWLRRLRMVAPFTPDGLGGTPLLDRLDRTYHSRHPTEWRAVLASEQIDYALMRRGETFSYPVENASYCNDDWCVYSVEDMISIDEWRYATD